MMIDIASRMIIYAITGIFSLAIAVYVLVQIKKTVLLYGFFIVQILVFAFSVINLLGNVLNNKGGNGYFDLDLLNASIRQLGDVAVYIPGLGWLVFCIFHIGMSRIRNKIIIPLVSIPVFAPYILQLTDYCLGLSDASPAQSPVLYHTNIIFYYAIFTAAAILATKQLTNQTAAVKSKNLFVLYATAFPPIFTIFSDSVSDFLNFRLFSGFDAASVLFSAGGLLSAAVIFKYRFSSIDITALKLLVDHIKSAFAVIDTNNRIVRFNEAFEATFSQYGKLHISDRAEKLAELLASNTAGDYLDSGIVSAIGDRSVLTFRGELALVSGSGQGRRILNADIKPLAKNSSEYLGRIITFDDITEYRELLDELSSKNSSLRAMYEKLEEHTHTAEALAMERERNRLAQDMHDTIGHTMTLVIALLERCSITLDSNTLETREILGDVLRIAREGLAELRSSVSGMLLEKPDTGKSTDALSTLVESFKASGTNVELTVTGEAKIMDFRCFNALYRLCQEALTNSLRHGKAENISVIVRFSGCSAEVFIFDDGIGCREIKKGNGLSGMENRIRSLNGRLTYGSDGEKGFNIHAEIPCSVLQIKF
jgi:signal transduction histidine kinase